MGREEKERKTLPVMLDKGVLLNKEVAKKGGNPKTMFNKNDEILKQKRKKRVSRPIRGENDGKGHIERL